MRKFSWFLPTLLLLAACNIVNPPTSTNGAGGGGPFIKAQLVRSTDAMGNFHNDEAFVTSPSETAQLIQYFPEIGTGDVSSLHNSFNASIVIDFARGDGSHVSVASDYHLYHDDSGHGDFVVNGDPSPLIEQIFAAAAKTPPDANAP